MKKLSEVELKKIIQSGHINLLLGAGCSSAFLSPLGNIENDMNNEEKKFEAQRRYYKLIKKAKVIVNEDTDAEEKSKLTQTKENYGAFLSFWSDVIFHRSLEIVNKQINIFTTNFDLFIEDSCERLGIPYNDGFTGQINRVFQVSNFNRIQKYKSLQFDNTSDVPMFNIIKIHGSLSWQYENKEEKEQIVYSDGLHIADDLLDKSKEEFEKEYKDNIVVVNPCAEKHLETVLDINYAAMLRKFTLELEKENSLLIIVGFSLKDKHIKELLYSVMQTNPTLIVIYFSHNKYDGNKDEFEEKKYPNLYVVSKDNEENSDNKQSFEDVTNYLKKIIFNDGQTQDNDTK